MKEWKTWEKQLPSVTKEINYLSLVISTCFAHLLLLFISFNIQRNSLFHFSTFFSILQYGLYSSFMACFVYTIFGSCKDVPVGPTAIIAILTRETLQKSDLGPDFAVLLTLISGCVCLLMGILHLGNSSSMIF